VGAKGGLRAAEAKVVVVPGVKQVVAVKDSVPLAEAVRVKVVRAAARRGGESPVVSRAVVEKAAVEKVEVERGAVATAKVVTAVVVMAVAATEAVCMGVGVSREAAVMEVVLLVGGKEAAKGEMMAAEEKGQVPKVAVPMGEEMRVEWKGEWLVGMLAGVAMVGESMEALTVGSKAVHTEERTEERMAAEWKGVRMGGVMVVPMEVLMEGSAVV